MAIVLTREELENTFQALIVSLLPGVDPNKGVRLTWPQEGQPGFEVTDSVVFLRVGFAPDPYTRLLELTYSAGSATTVAVSQNYTLVISLDLTFYGPGAFENADAVRAALFLPATAQVLAAQNLALVTDVPPPRRAPELFNGQWWERVDLSARFNEGVSRPSTVAAIASAPVTLVPQFPGS